MTGAEVQNSWQYALLTRTTAIIESLIGSRVERLVPRAELPLNPRYERWRWQIFGITWLVYASYYLTRQSFSVAKVALENDPLVALRRADFGLVDSAYLTAYMLGQFIFGPLGDRFGPRRILLFGMSLSILAAAASGCSTVLIGVRRLRHDTRRRAVDRLEQHVQDDELVVLAQRARPCDRSMVHSLHGGRGGGPALCRLDDGLLRPRGITGAGGLGIHSILAGRLLVPAAALAVVLVLTWLFLQNRPEDVGLPPIEVYHGEPESLLTPEETTHKPAEDPKTVIREVLATPSIWLLAISYFSIKLTRYAFYFWGPKYVFESLGSDAYASAMTAAAMPIGGLVGVIGIGYASDKWFQARLRPGHDHLVADHRRRHACRPRHISNIWAMAAFFFFVGVFLFGPDSIISGTAAMDFGTKRGAGTATGFVNGVGSIGGILGGYLPGVITSQN